MSNNYFEIKQVGNKFGVYEHAYGFSYLAHWRLLDSIEAAVSLLVVAGVPQSNIVY